MPFSIKLSTGKKIALHTIKIVSDTPLHRHMTWSRQNDTKENTKVINKGPIPLAFEDNFIELAGKKPSPWGKMERWM